MSSTPFSKSKAFREREQNAREKIRQLVKEDLVADLSRLFGDAAFSDVLFMVKNVEFHGHTAVLRARAPNFCQHFLPSHASPVSVQTCIQIRGLEAAEFEAFLRSVYTDDDFKEYHEASYPWRRQAATSSVKKNHVMSGISVQLLPHVTSSACPSDHSDGMGTSSPQNFCGQEDKTCTQSDCASDRSNNEGIVKGDMAIENICPAENIDVNFSKPSQCDSSGMCVSKIKFIVKECIDPPFLSDRTQGSETSVCTSCLTMDNTSQFDACNLVDGPVKEHFAKSLCQWTLPSSDSKRNETCNPLISDVAGGESTAAGTAFKLTSNIENGFHLGDTCTNLTVNHTGPNKTSQGDLEDCSCNLGQDLLHLLASEVGSDVTFLVNGEKVKAHKAILCARSNYFSAMLHGDWIEGKASEIPLVGVNYNGLMTVLRYIYGGIIHVKNDLALICDTLPLVDMYGLEGLRNVITCTLRITKCHLFHKPCNECIVGVSECLEVSELFGLSELKKSCVKWMAKHFDRFLGTKGFSTLPKQLQEEVVAEIQQGYSISSAIEVLNHCDRLSSCTPLVKWTEPVHGAVSSIQESCLLFIARDFFSLVDESTFHEILKGVGWSIPVLEKIISTVKRNLTIDNCCDQLRAILRLIRLLKLRTTEESEECYPEEVNDLVVSLHTDCVKFIRCNLFKVSRSEGWRRLKLTTQREIKEGAVFSGFGGESGNQRRPIKLGRNGASLASSSRTPHRSVSQPVGADSRARVLGRGGASTNGQLNRGAQQGRPSSSRNYQTRTSRHPPVNRRPLSGRLSSGQSSATPSSSKDISEKRGSSSRASMASENSRPSSSFLRNSSDKKPSSAMSGRGKMLSSQGFSADTPQSRRSRQSSGKAPLLTTCDTKKSSSTKKESSLAPGTSNGILSSAVGCSGTKNSKPASRPPLPSGNTGSKFSKGLRERASRVETPLLKKKNAPTKAKAQLFPNTRQVTRESNDVLPAGELSVATEPKNSSARSELLDGTANGVRSTTQASEEAGEHEKSHGCSIRAVDETCNSEGASVLKDAANVVCSGTQTNEEAGEQGLVSYVKEKSPVYSIRTVDEACDSEGASVLKDAANGVCSGTQTNEEAGEQGLVSYVKEKSHVYSIRTVDEACDSEGASVLKDAANRVCSGTQTNEEAGEQGLVSYVKEKSPVYSIRTVDEACDSEGASVLKDAANGVCSGTQTNEEAGEQGLVSYVKEKSHVYSIRTVDEACDSEGASVLMDAAYGVCSGTQTNKEASEQGLVSDVNEKSHGFSMTTVDEACDSECASVSQKLVIRNSRATNAGAESSTEAVNAKDSEENSLILSEGANTHSTDLQCHGSPNDFHDSLEVD